ncbi:protein TRACHEARY ELEMENT DIFFERENTIATION-RELATED 7A-like [Malania oleifera]|uniref:protein TRACHEARY ELEMENT DIFFERENTIATION-RELATED 7A-like n=1 Tax=Malania oleifera TaxID=397392 RepID=UPI0025AE8A17|nr:protein TRACHEARY ELEMENT DIFFERENTIATION-RELATED 7A-like [Malania oleifera]
MVAGVSYRLWVAGIIVEGVSSQLWVAVAEVGREQRCCIGDSRLELHAHTDGHRHSRGGRGTEKKPNKKKNLSLPPSASSSQQPIPPPPPQHCLPPSSPSLPSILFSAPLPRPPQPLRPTAAENPLHRPSSTAAPAEEDFLLRLPAHGHSSYLVTPHGVTITVTPPSHHEHQQRPPTPVLRQHPSLLQQAAEKSTAHQQLPDRCNTLVIPAVTAPGDRAPVFVSGPVPIPTPSLSLPL